jgi:flagellar hook-basal body complex protein FliE
MDSSSILGSVIPGTFVPDIPDETPKITPLGDGALGPQSSSAEPAQSFKDTVMSFLGDVNTKANTSDQNVQDLATGKTNDLNKVVSSVEEANLALQFTFAMKSQILNAYQEVSRMTV